MHVLIVRRPLLRPKPFSVAVNRPTNINTIKNTIHFGAQNFGTLFRSSPCIKPLTSKYPHNTAVQVNPYELHNTYYVVQKCTFKSITHLLTVICKLLAVIRLSKHLPFCAALANKTSLMRSVLVNQNHCFKLSRNSKN